MDWQTLVTRRTKKDPPQAGGWHAFFTSSGALSIPDPVAHFFLNAACEKALFGWPCDAEIERLRDAVCARRPMRRAGGPSPIAVQQRAAEYPTHVPLGQFTTPTAVRKNVTGLLTAPAVVFWNVEKK